MSKQRIRVLNGHAGAEGWMESLCAAGYDVDARPIREPAHLKALGREVPAAGLANGLVDFKICALDADWSGLLFSRRRAR